VLALGKQWDAPDGAANVTVTAYKTDAAPDAPAPSDTTRRWDGINVKVCVHEADASVSASPWSLVGSDDGNYTSSNITYNQFPLPHYPSGDHPVTPGECVGGWIIFDVPKTVHVSRIRYAVQDSLGNDLIVFWNP
jgi:hypothetical protein